MYGEPGTNRIYVYILGEVKQPGCYYIAKGTGVRDAIMLAKGLTKRAWWGHSGIIRASYSGLPAVMRFRHKSKAEKMELKGGD
jgi:SLBB domain